MYKLFAFWTAPDPKDVDAFEEHYTQTHAPLATRVPHLRKLVTTRTSEGLEGGEPAFYRVAEMVFDSKEQMEESTHSQPWQELRADAGTLIQRFGVGMTVAIGSEQESAGSSA